MAKTLRVDIVGDSSRLVAALKKGELSLKSIGKIAEIAGLAIAGGLAVGLEKSVKAAMAAEASTARLDQAFKNAGFAAKAYSTQIDAAQSSGRKLGFTDAEVKDSLGSLITATGNVSTAMRDLSLAEDLARLKHMDLASAGKFLLSTLAGNTRSAKALGIILLPVTANVDALRARYKALGEAIPLAELRTAKFADKQATAAESVRKVTEAVHGQAGAFADTAAGGMAQFHAQLDHLEVKMGQGLLPAVTAIVGKLSSLADWFSSHPDIAKGVIISLAALSAALITTSIAAFVLENVLTLGIAAGVTAAAVALALLITHFQQVGDWIQAHAYVLLAVPPIGAMLFLAAEIAKHWGTIKGIFSSALGFISGIVTSSWNTITSTVSAATGAVTGAVAAMVGAVTALFNTLKGVWESLRSVASRIIKFLLDTAPIQAAIAVIHALQSAWDALTSAASHVIHFVTDYHSMQGPAGPGPRVPPKARGGPVIGRHPYMVGELGPELFVPGSSGSIIPSGRFGGGGTNVYVTVQGALLGSSVPEVAATIRDEFLRMKRSNVNLGFS